MKTFNRFLALALAVVLVLSLAIVAGAAETETGTITIKDSTTVPVNGKTFAVYKLLDATFTADGKNAAYTVPENMKEIYKTKYGAAVPETGAADFSEKVVAKITEAASADAFAFAKEMSKLSLPQQGADVTGTDSGSVSFTNLPLGYYLVVEKSQTGEKIPVSALMLQNAKVTTVTIKADKPSLDKKIDGDTDKDPSTAGLTHSNSAAMGDEVPFVLTSKVPKMEGYEKYFFVVTDTLSKGLTYESGLQAFVDNKDVTAQCAIATSTTPAGETVIEVVFKNFIQYKDLAGKDIKITYKAKVNGDAVIGTEGNPNKANLTYSNNPNVTANGTDKPDEDEKDNVTGVTPDVQTKTFVTGLELHKKDNTGAALEGAEFTITGTALNESIRYETEFKEDASGDYYKLKNGTYTKQAPAGSADDSYESTTTKYKLQKKATAVKTPAAISGNLTVDPVTGALHIEGLAAGTYQITEVKAPDGYNKLKDPIDITITCGLPADATGTCTWTVSAPAAVVDGIVELDVVNEAGSLLPDTGGIGTTIFYVVGAVLMITALTLFITKKRMASEN